MKLLLRIISAIAIFLVMAVPVFAVDPPGSISVISAKVTRFLVEENDMLIVFHYNLDYASIPDEPASDTFSFRLYDTDGTTLLLSAIPYVYLNNGYGQGVSAFYFSAEDAPTWGGAYIINIVGSPAYFDPLPTPYNYPIASGDYVTVTSQSANRSALKSYI